MTEVSFPLSFLAGVVSFLSPCVLPLVPSYISFVAGVSFEELTSDEDRRRIRKLTVTNSLVFIAGFSTVFVALGASSSLLGRLFFNYQDTLRIVGGVIVIVFGLFMAGMFKMNFLMREWKFHLKGRPAGFVGAFFIGMAFAAGWTPCIGPILGSILVFAGSKGSAVYGLKLLSVYSLGLALPFLLSALAFNTFISYTNALKKHMPTVMLISGLLLVAFGVLLLTNKVQALSSYFPDIGINL
ncbi:MAG: cytochrome c biogenesis protein CcdA [Nitrospirota bacterium]|jgi:cytochrome c-type biogenesis protein